MYLSTTTTTQTVTALDQNKQVFTGDLSGVTVTSDQPGFVGATLSDFVNGVATLTLTQGAEGTANVTITGGSVTETEEVESYVPALTSFAIGASA